MKINKIYFSPTGSTKKIVNIVAMAWEGSDFDVVDIDCSVPGINYSTYSFAKDELCVIGVPSFGGRVPAIALSHLKQMTADGTPTLIITTYGNRDYDDTLLELQDTLKQKGFRVFAAIAAVAEHSIIRQFASGRPDKNDERELLEYAKRIRQTLEDNPAIEEITVKGNTPYRDFAGLPIKPKANSKCNMCGVCAKLCPMLAIPTDSPNKTDKKLCITCMRCVAVCPKQARKLNPALLFLAGLKMKKICSTSKKNELYLKTDK